MPVINRKNENLSSREKDSLSTTGTLGKNLTFITVLIIDNKKYF